MPSFPTLPDLEAVFVFNQPLQVRSAHGVQLGVRAMGLYSGKATEDFEEREVPIAYVAQYSGSVAVGHEALEELDLPENETVRGIVLPTDYRETESAVVFDRSIDSHLSQRRRFVQRWCSRREASIRVDQCFRDFRRRYDRAIDFYDLTDMYRF